MSSIAGLAVGAAIVGFAAAIGAYSIDVAAAGLVAAIAVTGSALRRVERSGWIAEAFHMPCVDLYEAPEPGRRPRPAAADAPAGAELSGRRQRRTASREKASEDFAGVAEDRAGRQLAVLGLHADTVAPVFAAPVVPAPVVASTRAARSVLRRSLPADPALLLLSAAWIVLLSLAALTPAFSDPLVRILMVFAAVPALLTFAWRSGYVLDRHAGTATRWWGFIGPLRRDVVRIDAFQEVKIDCGRSTVVNDDGPEDQYELRVSLVGTDAEMRLWRARVSIPGNGGVERWNVAPGTSPVLNACYAIALRLFTRRMRRTIAAARTRAEEASATLSLPLRDEGLRLL